VILRHAFAAPDIFQRTNGIRCHAGIMPHPKHGGQLNASPAM